jgi:hypothetical protein
MVPFLQIVGPTDNWILEWLARRLADKLPYATFFPWKPQLIDGSKIAYYLNYALYHRPSGMIDVALFTHDDESHQFLERARAVDHCVCMSRLYRDRLLTEGVENATHIPMGFDYYRYRPRLVLGVIGLLDHPRKGRHLVDGLRQLDFVEIITTEGKVPAGELRDLYQRIDYVLIPATVEGGPMSLLEGLAMGKPIIAPDGIGMVPEFSASGHLRLYPPGNLEALTQVVKVCYEEKHQRTRLVQERTWDHWAEAHDQLFTQLLRARGIEPPQPCAGFRFGMLGELDVPLGIDVEPLETAIDHAARHLFFGHFAQARAALEKMLPQYPFAAKLLDTFPGGKAKTSRRDANGDNDAKLGCVLAIQNRPAEYLERTLRTYAYQTQPILDKVLLDYGSEPAFAAAYSDLCQRYGWRYVSYTPPQPGWCLSAAYNQAVSALNEQVDVVFKSDIDVLLGAGVLERAARLGRDKLCIFSCLETVEGTAYPDRFAQPGDLEAIRESPQPPAPMLGEGIHAYPRRWFEEIGGFDLAFDGWGFEDSDLRVRAQKSIGVYTDTTALLIHQWHPRDTNGEQAAKNRAHYERMKTGPVARNGGKLTSDRPVDEQGSPRTTTDRSARRAPPGPSVVKDLHLAFATRSMNDLLYQTSSELLGLDRLAKHLARKPSQHRFTGTDSAGYFRELLSLDADWVVNLDEDVFLLEPEQLLDGSVVNRVGREGCWEAPALSRGASRSFLPNPRPPSPAVPGP